MEPEISGAGGGGGGEQEEDELDAFMRDINATVEAQKAEAQRQEEEGSVPKEAPKAQVMEQTEQFEGFVKALDSKTPSVFAEQEPTTGILSKISFDMSDNPLLDPVKMKKVDPLPPIDHTKIDYKPFRRNFYNEFREVASMPQVEVQALRDILELRVEGRDVPNPIHSFGQTGFDPALMKAIAKAGFESPTPIQAQALPIALSGRDLIGVAQTGSGKTLAYVWPMLVHMIDQPNIRRGGGPIGIILCPTRELAFQVYKETKRFAKVFRMKVALVVGGPGKYQQGQELKAGVELVVATPGRLIDHVKEKSTNLQRVTIAAVDEADRMFELGFDTQVRSLLGHCRPDRQTLMFSATFPKKVERLARDALRNPIKIMIGAAGQSNTNVRQQAVVLQNEGDKWPWLMRNLEHFLASGKVLIFVNNREGVDQLTLNINRYFRPRDMLLPQEGVGGGATTALINFAVAVHGDKLQPQREDAMWKFKAGKVQILVATDVAARGLDIAEVATVVNYDPAKNIDTHTHRIGRTGRLGGAAGIAYSLVTPKDVGFACDYTRNLEVSGQPVPEELLQVAFQNQRFATMYRDAGGSAVAWKQSQRRQPRVDPSDRGGIGFSSHQHIPMTSAEAAAASGPSSAYGGPKQTGIGRTPPPPPPFPQAAQAPPPPRVSQQFVPATSGGTGTSLPGFRSGGVLGGATSSFSSSPSTSAPPPSSGFSSSNRGGIGSSYGRGGIGSGGYGYGHANKSIPAPPAAPAAVSSSGSQPASSSSSDPAPGERKRKSRWGDPEPHRQRV